ncbi:MAG TPA: M15 family metallopeptidase [Bacillota bacterium]|nr:M15 family metallopeptidase [Bacillota bacterium]
MMKKWWKKLLLFGVVVMGTQLFPLSKIPIWGRVYPTLFSSFSSASNQDQGSTEYNPNDMRKEESIASTSETEAIEEVTNVMDPTVLVNKYRYLPVGYVPKDLVQPNIPFSFLGRSQKKLMRKEAALALEKLFVQAKNDHMNLVGVSAYRSFDSQNSIFKGNVKQQGEAAAKQVSAIPGHSEHQTGLAIDVSTPKIENVLEPRFGETDEGRWIVQNGPSYGFIVRYPQGKEQITGYTYEPWHIRYVGIQLAKEISEQNITLEEYWQTRKEKGSLGGQ